MAGNIEFVQGNEQHSSNWGKYYVRGLEKWQVKEDFSENRNDRHSSYQGYVCNDVPDGTVFTIFEQSGDKRGTDCFSFSICVVDQGEFSEDNVGYGSGLCEGNYKVICASGNSKTKAPRLMDWWEKRPADRLYDYALHCAAFIDKRGQKEIPPLPEVAAAAEPKLTPEQLDQVAAIVQSAGKDALINALLESIGKDELIARLQAL